MSTAWPAQTNLVLTLEDLQQGLFDVRLRWTINGPGVQLQTKSEVIFGAILLQSNIPTMLNGLDLAPYPASANFQVSGMDVQMLLSLLEASYRKGFT